MSSKIDPIDKIRSLALALVIAAGAGFTAATATADDLPKAEDLIRKHIEATGGEKAQLKLKNRRVIGTFSMPMQGLTGKIKGYGAEPNKFRVTVDLGDMGTIDRGSDGETIWENTLMTGARIMSGAEREMMVRETDFHALLNWKKHFKSVQTNAVEEVEGKTAFVVVAVPNSGTEETWYFDKASGLLVKTKSVVPTQMGELPLENTISDYREVDGTKMSFKTVQIIMGMQQVMTVQTVEHNVKLDSDTFALPEEIQALKKAAAQPKEPKAEPGTQPQKPEEKTTP